MRSYHSVLDHESAESLASHLPSDDERTPYRQDLPVPGHSEAPGCGPATRLGVPVSTASASHWFHRGRVSLVVVPTPLCDEQASGYTPDDTCPGSHPEAVADVLWDTVCTSGFYA